MLKAIPKRWFSWDFNVTEGSKPVAEIDLSWWREKGVLTIDGVSYTVYRERLMGGEFKLESAGSVLARAEKPSAFRRTFVIKHRDRHYTLKAKSAFRRAFVLMQGDREVGFLSPDGLFTRSASVHLPEELPLAVQIFITWLAIILWKRESETAASSG